MAGLFNTTSCTLKASSYRSNSSTRFSRSLEAMQLQKDNEIQNIPIRSFSIELNENKSLLGPPSMSHQIGLKDFEMHSVLGKGAFGKVFLVSRKSTNNYFAMKVLRKASLEIHNGENINIERNLLEAIGHPFIVKLFYAFQTSYKLYLVLQMANGGELFNLLYKEKMFSESTAVFYTSELLLALTHLHSLGIIYRDLKPENILLASDGHILLTDFGLSKESLEEEGARSIVGSAEFMAPEILNLDYYNEMVKTGDEPLNKPPSYSFSVDYWSLGILIFDMLTGHPPFTGGNNKTIMTKILNTKLKIPNYLSSYSKDIIIKLLKKTPSARISREMLFKHDFFRQIDFDKLFRKEIQPPHIPTIQDPTDLSHFNQEFTRMNVCDTPIASSECVDCGITCKCKNKFIGFSFEDLRRT